jgi:exodeoxyribonuclease V alpha subunit
LTARLLGSLARASRWRKHLNEGVYGSLDDLARAKGIAPTFAPGDKVMQIKNDYDKEVYNGDIGFIDDVDPDLGELTANFDGRTVTYGFGELDTLVPAYAATIHKSQGSEYPAVVIPVMTQHYAMLQRNLLYTGVTRGKRLVALVGQKKAVAIAVKNVSGRRRWSKLNKWLDTGQRSIQSSGT